MVRSERPRPWSPNELEQVAYWFFRLNGCLTIPNFVVHPDEAGSQRTDADVLAVRFPHRCELLTSGTPMLDHPMFGTRAKTDLIIAEVKTAECNLNGPWTRSEDENMHRVLYAIGLFPFDKVPDVATALYEQHQWEGENCLVRLVTLGRQRNRRLPETVTQVEWPEVLGFIHERFRRFRGQKRHNTQWDGIGRRLFRLAERMATEQFIAQVLGDDHHHGRV